VLPVLEELTCALPVAKKTLLVTVQVAVNVPLVAVMIADPMAIGVTKPVVETVAIEVLLLVQVTVAVVGVTVAVSW
jgi:hypothetical protein